MVVVVAMAEAVVAQKSKRRQNEAKRNMSNLYSLQNCTISVRSKSEKKSRKRTSAKKELKRVLHSVFAVKS